jgi:broad-specificity NMP kinase
LGELVKREGLTSGYDREKLTWIVDEDKLAARLRQILKKQEGVVVVDGHYATGVIPGKQVERVFVLRRDPRQLREMMEKRGFMGEKLLENLAAEVLDVVLFEAVKNLGSEKLCEIDTTDKTVDDIVKVILSLLKSGEKCVVGVVDWIGKLEREGVLDEYLR